MLILLSLTHTLVTFVLNINKAGPSSHADHRLQQFEEVHPFYIFILVNGIRWVPQYPLMPTQL